MFCCKLGQPYFLLVFTFLWLWWWTTSIIHVRAANDSLKPGGTLNATTELCSENNQYCMGFSVSYLRIHVSRNYEWAVWIANRDQPVDSNSTVLLLNHSGVLKIESQHGEPIILYSSPQATNNSNNTVATLLNTGNFVLHQLHPNGSTKSVLWQSFDYPTDTLFPGMKLGVNHKTGHKWSLVSWFSAHIPTSGPFRLEWEPRGRELVIRRRERVYWKSGKLINNRFEHIPEDAQNLYEYIIVSNEDEDSFKFNTSNDELTKWTLLETGQLIIRERTNIDIARADMCYGYNTDGGCQKWEEVPTCKHPGDVFDIRVGYPNYFSNNTSFKTNTSYAISDCQASCLSNCSCVGFKSLYANGTGCEFFLWNSTEVNIAAGGENFYMLVKKTQNKGGTKKWIWISAVIAITLLIICSSILCLAINKRKHVLEDTRRKRMETEMQDLTASSGSSGIKHLEDDLKKGHDLKVFNYTSVMAATNGFSSENKLGQGGFGPVYKGILPTGQEVAIKRLSKTSGQGIVEFKNELTLICELQHMNLVQLLGCCIHEEERMLIYEYMPNKSLDFFLFDGTRSKLLDWKKRFNIIEGISQGLLYLHKHSRLKVIHRDLKAGNILLDENMNPKISDFGMARMFTQEESATNTSRIVGTYGYMSPEYAMEGVFSTKSDVYSFGVLLLEIVSGRRNNSFYDADRPLNLIGHAWELWSEGMCLQLMDPSLNDTFVPDEVQRCIHIGLLCVEQYAHDRPKMSDIISMLTNKSAAVTLPRKPAFYVGRGIYEAKTSSKEFYTDSTKEISAFSEVE